MDKFWQDFLLNMLAIITGIGVICWAIKCEFDEDGEEEGK